MQEKRARILRGLNRVEVLAVPSWSVARRNANVSSSINPGQAVLRNQL